MANNVLQVEIKATLSGLTEGLKAANDAVAQTSQKMRGDLAGIGSGGTDGSKGVLSLAGALKAHRSEMRAESGLTKVLSRDLAGLGVGAKGAGGDIAHLLSSFAVGGGFGAALAVVKLMASSFIEARAEAKQWAEETNERIKKIIESTKELRAHLLGITSDGMKMANAQTAIAEKTRQIAELEADIDESKRSAMAAGEDMRQFESSEAATKRQQIELLRQEIGELERKRQVQARTPSSEAERKGIEEASNLRAAEAAKRSEREKKEATDRERREREEMASRIESDRWEADFVAKKEREREKMEEAEVAKTKARANDEAEYFNKIGTEEMNKELHRQSEERKELQKRATTYEQFGSRVGNALGGMFSGTQTPLQGFISIMQEVVRAVGQSAIQMIMADAPVAGAEAAKSQAGIPVIGPLLAVGAMSAMISMVLGLLGSIPSAAGGWSVPSDTLAMVHSGEHILPANIAQAYEQGAPGGSGTTIVIQAMDAQSFHAYAKRNARTILGVARGAQRDGK